MFSIVKNDFGGPKITFILINTLCYSGKHTQHTDFFTFVLGDMYA